MCWHSMLPPLLGRPLLDVLVINRLPPMLLHLSLVSAVLVQMERIPLVQLRLRVHRLLITLRHLPLSAMFRLSLKTVTVPLFLRLLCRLGISLLHHTALPLTRTNATMASIHTSSIALAIDRQDSSMTSSNSGKASIGSDVSGSSPVHRYSFPFNASGSCSC